MIVCKAPKSHAPPKRIVVLSNAVWLHRQLYIPLFEPKGISSFVITSVCDTCRYVALTTGIIEVQQDKKRSTASPANTDRKAEYERISFDLATREGLESYWAQLAQMSVDYRSVDGTPENACASYRRLLTAAAGCISSHISVYKFVFCNGEPPMDLHDPQCPMQVNAK